MRRGCSRASSSAPRASSCWFDGFAHRSFHAQIKEKAGHTPLFSLKLLKADPAQVLAQSEDIKARYTRIFKV